MGVSLSGGIESDRIRPISSDPQLRRPSANGFIRGTLTCLREKYSPRSRTMIRTHGLSHIALAVKDAERSFKFYERVVGAVAVYRKPNVIQAQTPGSFDVLVFQTGEPKIGEQGGIAHFGFRLVDPYDITCAIDEIKAAGGAIIETGEFCPGEPFVFFKDPDGYSVEMWFELPTHADP